MAPPFGEDLALDPNSLHVLIVWWDFDGWHHPAQFDPRASSSFWIDMNSTNRAHQGARGRVELLSFPFIHVGPDGVTVCPGKSRVHTGEGLHVVVAGRQVVQR